MRRPLLLVTHDPCRRPDRSLNSGAQTLKLHDPAVIDKQIQVKTDMFTRLPVLVRRVDRHFARHQIHPEEPKHFCNHGRGAFVPNWRSIVGLGFVPEQTIKNSSAQNSRESAVKTVKEKNP